MKGIIFDSKGNSSKQ